MSIVIPRKNRNESWACCEILKVYGDEIRYQLYQHYFRGSDVYAWFIGKPDKDYQNSIAQMGKNALVIEQP